MTSPLITLVLFLPSTDWVILVFDIEAESLPVLLCLLALLREDFGAPSDVRDFGLF